MARIFTKTGDGGHTSLYAGGRVPKDNPRIELNGEIDELNAVLGMLKVKCGTVADWNAIQSILMDVMAVVADTVHSMKDETANKLCSAIQQMEAYMCENDNHEDFVFELPGQSEQNAWLHIARAKVRSCERRLVTLNRTAPQPDILQMYLNRLSDYLFVLSCKV